MIIYAFTKNNCGPCAAVKPALEQINVDAQALGISVHFVNTDEQDASALLQQYGIRSVPTLVITHDDGTMRDIVRGLSITAEAVRNIIKIEQIVDTVNSPREGDPTA